jgi:hypothetical protein
LSADKSLASSELESGRQNSRSEHSRRPRAPSVVLRPEPMLPTQWGSSGAAPHVTLPAQKTRGHTQGNTRIPDWEIFQNLHSARMKRTRSTSVHRGV